MNKVKLTKCEYERYLTDQGFPDGMLKSLGLRKTTSYGRWLRINKKEEFDEGYKIWKG
jgi:hypothetical protein